MTADLSPEALADLAALEAAATPGPWTARVDTRDPAEHPVQFAFPPHVAWVHLDEQDRRITTYIAECNSYGAENAADAAFIAAIRNAAPALLAALALLRRIEVAARALPGRHYETGRLDHHGEPGEPICGECDGVRLNA